MSVNRLIYLPLGGAGEIGMNSYVYGYGPAGKERLILVDLGVTFPDMDSTPGIELILPDTSWLEARLNQLEAIFITHAHEDHIGALGHLWPKLRVPVYARRFTAMLGKLKLEEQGHPSSAINVVPARPETVEVGPFKVQFVPVSHSIPESAALVIDTPAGRVVHSGDFKLDHTPVVGEGWDDARFSEIVAEQPIKALMCDSTNVFSLYAGQSESTIREPLCDLIKGHNGLVVATTFASNVARLKTLAEAARAAGRSVCLMGRAMKRMVSVAQEAGVLTDFPSTISPEDAVAVPRGNLMLIVTGSQGERRAATAQLSRGKYLGMELKKGDLFLFSSKTIPGNEREVLKIINNFSQMGVDVMDENGGKYHVSGHANRPDLEHVHRLFLPKMLIPMHGEHRHLREHARIAIEGGIVSDIVTNGMMVDITGDTPKVVDYIETGRTYLDGLVLIGAMDGIVRDRIRMALNGHVTVTLLLDDDNEMLGDALVELLGVPEQRRGLPLVDALEKELNKFLNGVGKKLLYDDEKLEEALRRIVRHVCIEEIGKKPEVTVVVSRLTDEWITAREWWKALQQQGLSHFCWKF